MKKKEKEFNPVDYIANYESSNEESKDSFYSEDDDDMPPPKAVNCIGNDEPFYSEDENDEPPPKTLNYVIDTESKIKSENYIKLKQFFQKNNFKLFGDIDFWYDEFEVAFFSDSHHSFADTDEARKWFLDKGFNVIVSEKRKTYREQRFDFFAKFKATRFNKTVYILRLSCQSTYFQLKKNEIEEEESTFSISDEHPTYDSSPLRMIPIWKALLIPGAFCLMMLFACFLFPSHGKEKRPDNLPFSKIDFTELNDTTFQEDIIESTPDRSIDTEAYSAAILQPVYIERSDFSDFTKAHLRFDLNFETTEGTKTFSNARFKIKGKNVIVETYSKEHTYAIQTDIFKKDIIKSISCKRVMGSLEE